MRLELESFPQVTHTTLVFLAAYVAVLLTIASLIQRINARLTRLSSLATSVANERWTEPSGEGRRAPRLSHIRSNLCELGEGLQQATPRQRAEYAAICTTMVQDACDYIDPSGGERKIAWARRKNVGDAAVFLARLPDNPIVLIKGVVLVRIPAIEKLAQYFAGLDSTEAMRHSIAKLDPMFLDGRVICRLHGLDSADGEDEVPRPAPVAGEEPVGRTQVEWACFAAPPPLAPRDFCWLEHSTFARARDGSRLFMSLCSSVEREEAPDLWASHGYVRASLRSTGYVFRQTAPGAEAWELSYVVQIEPRGIIPTWVVNLVAADQASNAAAMRSAVHERMGAEDAMRGPLLLLPATEPLACPPAAECARAEADGRSWAGVPLQEALLKADGSCAVVSLGQLAPGQTVEWRWMAGGGEGGIGCSLEEEAEAPTFAHDAGRESGESKARPAATVERTLPCSHALLRAEGCEGPEVHASRAATLCRGHHWIKWTRPRSFLQRMHWAGLRPVTIFLQVRIR